MGNISWTGTEDEVGIDVIDDSRAGELTLDDSAAIKALMRASNILPKPSKIVLSLRPLPLYFALVFLNATILASKPFTHLDHRIPDHPWIQTKGPLELLLDGR